MPLRLCALGVGLFLATAFAGPSPSGSDIKVADEGAIRDKWMLAEGVPLAVPQYPVQFARRHDTVCVGLGYLLNPDGTTSDFALVKAWSSAGTSEPEAGYWSAFAEAAADALKQWRFKPRPEVARPQPVYTVATFVFGVTGGAAQFRARCAAPNLVARLRELRGARGRRGGDILDRLDLADYAEATSGYRRPN